MAFEQIRYDTVDGVATVTLNRPEKLNAVTSVLLREMLAAFDHADADDAVRAVIVTGAGRAFCAGADLSAGTQTFDRSTRQRPEGDGEHRDGGGLVALRIYDMKKPVIAAINGPAVGFGVTMTLPMDIRIASSAARMGFVFARRGVVPEACSTWFLPRLVGIQQAAEWVYTGRVFGADEALAGGLVSRVVAPEALLPTAMALAREIADNTSGRLGRAGQADDVEAPGRGSPHGSPPPRLARHGLDGTVGRRARRHHVLSREAPAALHSQAQPGHAALLPVVERALL